MILNIFGRYTQLNDQTGLLLTVGIRVAILFLVEQYKILLYSHLHVHAASQRYNNNKDRHTQKDA